MTTGTHLGLDLGNLRTYLASIDVEVVGELEAHLITGGKSNLTYLVSDERSRWVLRRPPTAGLTPSAHDMGREYRVTSALQGSAVPVPEVIAMCDDPTHLGAPFSLVGFVEGTSVRTKDDLAAFDDGRIDGCADELVRVLAELHRVDHEAVGLGDFGRPEGYLRRQVALWAKQWSRVKTEESADLDRLHALLDGAVPEHSGAAIVHGDYRVDNTLLRPDDTIAAVVDWEMSTVGDPLTDVALMCVYRAPVTDLAMGFPAAWTSSRWPSGDDLAQRYATAADSDLPHWDFYVGLANFKVAVIAEGINHRYRAGATVGDGFDRAGEAVPEFISAGLRAMGGARQ